MTTRKPESAEKFAKRWTDFEGEQKRMVRKLLVRDAAIRAEGYAAGVEAAAKKANKKWSCLCGRITRAKGIVKEILSLLPGPGRRGR